MSARPLLVLACALPLWFSLPALEQPFGQSEESVNATIWGLGARNLLADGPQGAMFGARVAPYPGSRDGIYAHHPPLVVWLSALVQALFGAWEGGPRLCALLLAAAALYFLFGCARLVASEEASLIAVAAAATSPYLLGNARMLTTLTLATPLFAAALQRVLGRRTLDSSPPVGGSGASQRLRQLRSAGPRRLRAYRWLRLLARDWAFPALVAALVLSSWDGVLGAAALVLYERRRAPLLAFVAALGLVLAYLVWANGGAAHLFWQARYRALPAPGILEWAQKQLGFVGGGLGWLSLLALVCAPAFTRAREKLAALALAAVPGVGMTLLFRQGADRHAFWAYNLALPAALAVALAIDRVSRHRWAPLALRAALAAQAFLGFRAAGAQLERDGWLNRHGALVQQHFAGQPVMRIAAAYNFYPFVSWYLRVPVEVSREPAWTDEALVALDTDLGCAAPAREVARAGRWIVAPASAVRDACRP